MNNPTQSSFADNAEKAKEVKEIIEKALESQSFTNTEVLSVLHSLIETAESDQEHIIRGLTLPFNYRIAGLLLLSFFTRLVELQHPHIWVKYTTTQDGEHIKLILEVEKQHRNTVENMLEHYSRVLLKEAPLNVLAKDNRQLMELKKILDLSALEVSINKEIETGNLEDVSDSMESFSEEVQNLHGMVGRGIGNMHELQTVIASLLAEKHEAVGKALLVLRERLHVHMSPADEQEVKEALLAVKEYAPDSFEEIRQLINQGSVSGAAGDMLYSWIASLSSLMPK